MKKNKSDYLIKTLACQLLVCAVMFGVLLGLKNSNSSLYFEIKDIISNELTKDIMPQDIENVFNTVKTAYEADMDNTSEEEYVPIEEPSLSAEVKSKGGADTKVSSPEDIPANVSVNSYELNKPMVMPLEGVVTSKFGVRTHPVDGDLRFHAGIDIAADMGTPIYAAFDGEVITAKYDRWNGNYIKLSHDNNITTVYCHCQKINVSAGQIIRAGEVIGFVGSTGISTGPHLHFELRINDVSYNPETALSEAVNAL